MSPPSVALAALCLCLFARSVTPLAIEASITVNAAISSYEHYYSTMTVSGVPTNVYNNYVYVTLWVNLPYYNDPDWMDLWLTAPNGNRIEVSDEAGGSCTSFFANKNIDDYQANSVDSGYNCGSLPSGYLPHTQFYSHFSGSALNGNWLFEVNDWALWDDSGTVTAWGIIFHSRDFILCLFCLWWTKILTPARWMLWDSLPEWSSLHQHWSRRLCFLLRLHGRVDW